MSRVTSTWAKGHFAEVLDNVEAGDDVEVTRRGKVVAVVYAPIRTEKVLRAGTKAHYTSEHVQSAENDEPMPSGVLRPAPAAADQFADHVQPAVSEQAPATPPQRPEDSPEHKKTAPAPVLARSPASQPLTLADIIRAGGGQS